MYGQRFNFGKHKGKLVEDVPTSYLRWVVAECVSIDSWLLEAVKDELRRRQEAWQQGQGAYGQQRQTAAGDAGPPANWSDVMQTWYRGLCLKYHPDRGGSTEAMQIVNDAYDRLKQLAGV